MKSEVETALAELREKLKGQDTAAIRVAMERAGTVAQQIGAALYAQAQGTEAGGGPTSSTGGGEEEVVDAEIIDEENPKGDAR